MTLQLLQLLPSPSATRDSLTPTPPHPPAHRRTNVMETRSAPASLQLWQFPRQGAAAPSLAYAVVHQGGVCLGVEACRSEGLPGCLVEVR